MRSPSSASSIPVAVTAMRQGVTGVLEKPVRPGELLREIHAALRQSQGLQAAAERRRQARDRIANLSESELEVLKLVVSGTPNKNMATQMKVAMRTIEKYRRSMFDKLSVDSAAEATQVWMLAHQDD